MSPAKQFEKLCKGCNKIKELCEDNFQLKFIVFQNEAYIPIFEAKCKECDVVRKRNPITFNAHQFEKQTGTRKCKKCSSVFPLNSDYFRQVSNGKYFRGICLNCDRLEANKSTKKRMIYARDDIRISKRKHQKNRRKRDPVYKLRKYTSTSIYRALRRNGKNKNGKSIMNYLPYQMGDLKAHLENQFESWMNWGNLGKYDPKTWDDNNPTTWKWNVDHIIPHSLFPYIDMADENFKKCWALENLRPYSAKLNVIEGARKI